MFKLKFCVTSIPYTHDGLTLNKFNLIYFFLFINLNVKKNILKGVTKQSKNLIVVIN